MYFLEEKIIELYTFFCILIFVFIIVILIFIKKIMSIEKLIYLLWKFNSDNAFRMNLYRCAPEFQFRMYGAVEYKFITFCMERGYRWVM